ncbi:hypothetical protein ACF07T_23130 [Streptomyces sp. NPDC015184]|uniref:hypothetical protein n=1 Tax=Streptomyces sp. NPDC015184 TaxID=3364946 RepID=UPI0036FC782C
MRSGASTEPPRAVLERLRAVDWYGGLDAGAVGRITYCAKAGEGRPRNSPRGILRRRLVGREAETHDEVLTHGLRREPAECLGRHGLGHDDIGHVQISEREAAAFIESAVKELTDSRQADGRAARDRNE